MNKFYIIVFLICLFVCSKVEAYTCGYYTENGTWHFHIDYTVEDGEITFKDDYSVVFWERNLYSTSIMDFEVAEKYKNKTNSKKIQMLVELFGDGKCQKRLYLCEGLSFKYSSGDHPAKDYAILFESQYLTEAKEYVGDVYTYNFGNDLNKANLNNNIMFEGNNNCFEINVYESSVIDAEIVDTIGEKCDFLSKYIDGDGKSIQPLKNYYINCKKSGGDDCYQYDKNKSIIKTYCYSTIEHTSYDNICLKKCSTEVPDIIGEIESSFNGKTCHLSDKIIKFAANILKWGKYFAPALVIILSLLDFVKALAAQNDDDMKKSQARFIKRLISAVLLFIIPMLIYFVLDKFNLINADPFCKLI